METNTITIASLASVIGLGLLRMFLKSKGFKLSLSSGLFNIQARFGRASPNSSSDDLNIPRLSSRRQSRTYPTSP
jgi:hypothetical protein